MLDGFVPVLGLAAEFFFLQSRVGGHPRKLVAAGQFEHAQVQGMESGQRHELEFVSHLRQFGLKAGDRGFVNVLPPVETRRAVVGQHLVRILRANCLCELLGFGHVGVRSFAPDQVCVRSVDETTSDRRLNAAANAEESFRRALAGAEGAVALVDIAGQKIGAVGVGASHDQRGHAHDISRQPGCD